jgi:hypothetical protein
VGGKCCSRVNGLTGSDALDALTGPDSPVITDLPDGRTAAKISVQADCLQAITGRKSCRLAHANLIVLNVSQHLPGLGSTRIKAVFITAVERLPGPLSGSVFETGQLYRVVDSPAVMRGLVESTFGTDRPT